MECELCHHIRLEQQLAKLIFTVITGNEDVLLYSQTTRKCKLGRICTYQEAVSSPVQPKWKKAMRAEMKTLKENEVWELVELPSGWKTVGNKWVFKTKIGESGSVERYKARLVAQRYGTDYDETFRPVARQEYLRVLLALSVQDGLKLHQVDVVTAFLNGNLEEEVYMAQPEGFVSQDKSTLYAS